jgi:hypothetical protein
MSDLKIVESKRVARPATKEEQDQFVAAQLRKGGAKTSSLKIVAMPEKTPDQIKRKAEATASLQNFISEVNERAKSLTIDEWVNEARNPTPEELAQAKKDQAKHQARRKQEAEDRAERQTKLDALVGKLGISKEDLVDALRAAQEGARVT